LVDLDDELIEYLLALGVLEYQLKDEDGNPIYRLTKEAEDLVPEIYKTHMQEFNAGIFSLWTKDMIDIVFDEDGDPMIGLNENSENSEKISYLDKKDRNTLAEITFIWKKNLY
jgi:hypothetical protein